MIRYTSGGHRRPLKENTTKLNKMLKLLVYDMKISTSKTKVMAMKGIIRRTKNLEGQYD
jgi:hypothetical protein